MQNRNQSRVTPNYYRVGFYGEGFGDDAGKEYVYRASPSTRLADFIDNMKSRYEKEFGAPNFEVLKNRPIEELQLDRRKNYVQVVNCEVVVDSGELGSAEPSFALKSFANNKFVFETPYDPEGLNKAPSEEVGKQWRRKVTVTTADCFPLLVARSLIQSKEVVRFPRRDLLFRSPYSPETLHVVTQSTH